MAALIATVTALLLSGSPPANRVVARVNGEAISAERFREELARRFEAAALNDLIADKLLEQEARRRRIKIDVREIQRRAISQRGDEAALAVQRRNYLLDEISKRATVIADAEIRFVYNSNKLFFVEPAQYRLRDLVLGSKDDADQVYDLLRTGGDFAQVARQLSIDGASRARGGDLGWLPLSALASPLRDTASTIRPGELSRPIQLGDEWHLLKLESRRPERQKTMSEVRAAIHQSLFQERQAIVRHNLLHELRRKARLEIRLQYPESSTRFRSWNSPSEILRR